MASVRVHKSRRSKIIGLIEGPKSPSSLLWRQRSLAVAQALFFVVLNLGLMVIGYERALSPGRLMALLCVCGMLAVFLGEVARRNEVAEAGRSVWGVGVAVLLPLLLMRLADALGLPRQLVPTPLLAACFGMIYGPRVALAGVGIAAVSMGVCADLRLGLGENVHFETALVSFVGGALAIAGTEEIKTRGQLIRLGLLTGVLLAFAELVGQIYTGRLVVSEVATHLGSQGWKVSQGPFLAFLNGVLFGYVLFELLPLLEKWFGVVPDVRLLAIGDLNQAFFRRFRIEAPGTFHHSQMVGVLAEAAAQSVGANMLLAKVGAYYHDIGKLYRPEYFTENNLGGPNRHDNLTPQMSTLIIIAHTKDGLEIARELNLPAAVSAFIPEHHGTSCVEYFYHRAKQAGGDVSREQFRYPGPKPQSPESGIVMISDSVEAISRSLRDPTPSRLENIVHEVVIDKLMDGQLDESDLTLSDLKKMEQSLYRVLVGIFHSRIKYPEKERKGLAAKLLETSAPEEKP